MSYISTLGARDQLTNVFPTHEIINTLVRICSALAHIAIGDDAHELRWAHFSLVAKQKRAHTSAGN